MKKLTFLLCLVALAGCTTVPRSAKDVGWNVGCQAYTFRSGTFFEAVDKTAAAGAHYIEAYPGQPVGGGIDARMGPGLDAAARQKVLAKLAEAGVTLVNFGVAGAGNEQEWRNLFAFAKDMGIRTIVAEPAPEQMKLVDSLCKSYGVNVAIHNHPKPSRYWNPDVELAAFKGCSKRIGVCADVGHWVRSGLDPVTCLKKLQGRIITLHFKDLSAKDPAAHDVPWGTGISNVPGVFAELKRQGFRGVFSIEYEHETPALAANARRCVQYFDQNAPLTERELRSGKAVVPGMTPDVNQVWAGTKPGKADLWPVGPKPLLKSDLSNAICKKDSWQWEDGVLTAKGGGDIWTKETYGDFVLELDFKCDTNTNSGVFLRCADVVNWLHTSIEVQILQPDEADKKHICGAIFDCLAPTKNAIKPVGEWNHYKITAKANRIQVELNGEQIINMDLNQWTEAHKNPDGSPNKFNTAYKDMARTGHIGLQYHGHPVWFRNLTIKPID